MQKPKKTTQRKVGRDAKPGQLKSKESVKKHAVTAVKETVVLTKPKKPKK
jgi:hypothetical protein